MKCPFCNNENTKVLDKRETDDSKLVTRRRRECTDCSKRFTTYEKIESNDLIIIKRDGRREPFSKEKIMKGFMRACEKRPIQSQAINKAVDEIELELLCKKAGEVQSKKIGELVMSKLFQLDNVAYIRFASVYRKFADVNDFTEEIKNLKSIRVKNKIK